MDKYCYDGTKLLWHMDRVIDHFDKGNRIAPIHIDMGATATCNSDCVYCYAKHQGHGGEILDRDVFLRLMEEAPKVGVKSIAIIGDGEPTLNPALYDAVRVGKENGLDLSVGTNGIALTPEKIDALLKNCVWVRFNLSAGTSEGYKLVHGKDNWDRVSHNIRVATLIKKKNNYACTIGLQMVLIPQCIDEVIPEAKFAVNAGVDYLVVKQYSDPVCDKMAQVNRNWYSDDKTKAILKKAESMSTDKTQIIIKWGLMQFHDNKPYKHCVDTPVLIEISGTGKVYNCGYYFRDPNYELGDLNKQSIGEILDSDRYWEIVKYLREKHIVGKDCHGACRHDMTNCFIWNYLHKPEHINFI
jgi:MoaA/NifB/PqqE/SkfB family radical SAM enzyme